MLGKWTRECESAAAGDAPRYVGTASPETPAAPPSADVFSGAWDYARLPTLWTHGRGLLPHRESSLLPHSRTASSVASAEGLRQDGARHRRGRGFRGSSFISHGRRFRGRVPAQPSRSP